MRRALLSSLVLVLPLVAGAAQAAELRYTTTAPGNVVAVGNTLGLSKESSLNGPGTADAIGTFITLDANSVDNLAPLGAMAWPAGTTADWQQNGSAATLVVPSEGQVLYAELVWGGSHEYGGEDVSAFLDDPVVLSFGADSLVVTPDAVTATTVEATTTFSVRYYMRSGEVTDFIAQHGSGSYSVEGVPGTQAASINTTNAAGWSLIVAYRYDSEPIRNLSVFVGDTAFVDENTTVDFPVDGFCAPPAGVIEGTIAIATVEGDSNRPGDLLAIGQTAASTFVNLSGPNNPETNFFCSQINGPDGLLDATGSFGNQNHTPGTNTSGARQGWDNTHVGLSSVAGHLVPGQTSAVLRTQTLSDSYMPVLAGIAIDVNAPTFLYQASTTVIDKTEVTLGESFNVTVTLANEGTATAENVRFLLPLADGLDLTSFETDGVAGDDNGNNVVEPDLTTGVDMGDVAPGVQRVVSLDVQVNGPQEDTIIILPVWEYGYTMCAGSSTNESFGGQVQGIDYIAPTGEGGGSEGGAGGGTAQGGAGEGGAGGDAPPDDGGSNAGGQSTSGGGGAGEDGSDEPPIEDGCDCTVGARSGPGLGAGLSLIIAAMAGLRRRKRRSV